MSLVDKIPDEVKLGIGIVALTIMAWLSAYLILNILILIGMV